MAASSIVGVPGDCAAKARIRFRAGPTTPRTWRSRTCSGARRSGAPSLTGASRASTPARAAGRFPGVRAVLTGADLTGARIGKKIVDMPLLADGVVRYIGEKVAAVAADSEAAAAAAAVSLIDVEYEETRRRGGPGGSGQALRPADPSRTCPVTQACSIEMDAPSNVFVRLEWKQGRRRRGLRRGRPGGGEHLHHADAAPRVYRAPLLHRGGQGRGRRDMGLHQEPVRPAGPHGRRAGHSRPQDRRPSRATSAATSAARATPTTSPSATRFPGARDARSST